MSGTTRAAVSGLSVPLGVFAAKIPVAHHLDRSECKAVTGIILSLIPRAILPATGATSILTFGGRMPGLVDVGLLSIKTA
ncbi:hypothetical protein [Pararhodobacter sp.]